jgi:serine/threonine-protein kinase
MARRDTNRNLLFGIMTLQMDYITRDALVAALRVWVEHRERSLGQILVDQGALSADDRRWMETAVDRHIQQHGNDPSQSLAAISSLGSALDVLREIPDPDLQESLASVGSTSNNEADKQTTLPPPTEPALPRGRRFRILHWHGGGGLGDVFAADDIEVPRKVALKRIREQYADDEVHRERFRREAKITGKLDHPGVVPIYGLGHDLDGRPYYAMRFIRGDNLEAAIKEYHREDRPASTAGERSVEFRRLLGRFIDVCDTIAFAHSRGFLHRDLKPGNIMLGQYGETLVVDWGLAKDTGRRLESDPVIPESDESTMPPRIDSDLGETPAGKPLGTVGYMSPEQAAGRIEHLGAATDIYSLGATLYALLTGRAPFHGADRGILLNQILQGRLAPPRQINRQVPPALEAICLKAMALHPEERYRTAKELATDVEHWLADEPVSAWREPWTARWTRWARRHKPVVAGVGGLLGAAVIALSVSTILISKERAQAVKNYQQARRGADLLIEVAHQDVADDMPQITGRQKALLEEALSLERELLLEKPTDQELRQKQAHVLEQVARLYKSLGDNDKAKLSYQDAISRFEKLGAEFPQQSDFRHHLAICHNDLGEVLRATNPSEAPAHYRAAQEIQDKLVADFPGEPDYRQELGRTLNNLGILLAKDGKPAAATAYRKSSGYFRTLLVEETLGLVVASAVGEAASQPATWLVGWRAETMLLGKPAYRNGLARSSINLGKWQERNAYLQEAEQSNREAIALLALLTAQYPANTDYRFKLATTYNNLAVVLTNELHPHAILCVFDQLQSAPLQGGLAHHLRYLFQLQEAEALLRRAIELLERLVGDFPEYPLYRKELANTNNTLGFLLYETDRKAAERACEEARRLFHQLVARDPDTPEYQSLLGLVLGGLGQMALDSDDPDRARKLLDAAINHQGKARKRDSASAEYLERLAGHYNMLGEINKTLKKPTEQARAEIAEHFVRAMLLARQKLPEKARGEYAKAVQAIERNRLDDAELTRLQEETETLLPR